MLAIIIPFYNIYFFKETLESLKSQTQKDFKVYIGNDGSPNDPTRLIETFSKELPIKYHHFQENMGARSLVQHWRRCVELIQDEEWICILGDDDVLATNFVEKFYKSLPRIKENKINVVRTPSQIIDDNGNITSAIFNHPEIENSLESFIKVFRDESRSSLSEYVFSRKVYQQFGFADFPLAWHSDDLAWLQFSGFQNIYSLQNVVNKIRISSKNISGKSDNHAQKRKATLLFLRKLLMVYPHQFSVAFRNELIVQFKELSIKTKCYTFKNSVTIIVHLLYQLKLKEAFNFFKKVIKHIF